MDIRNKLSNKQYFVLKDHELSLLFRDFNKWIANNNFNNVALSGGTALSKGYKIIQRLSEDIDLIIFIDKNNSKTKCKKIKKEIEKYSATII